MTSYPRRSAPAFARAGGADAAACCPLANSSPSLSNHPKDVHRRTIHILPVLAWFRYGPCILFYHTNWVALSPAPMRALGSATVGHARVQAIQRTKGKHTHLIFRSIRQLPVVIRLTGRYSRSRTRRDRNRLIGSNISQIAVVKPIQICPIYSRRASTGSRLQ